MAEPQSRESVSQSATAAVLRAMLQDVDPSARLDLNGGDAREDGRVTYEVRIYGHHVGYVAIRRGGSLEEWI